MWKERMNSLGLNSDETAIFDEPKISIEQIDKLIDEYSCNVVAIDYLQLLIHSVSLNDLKELLQRKGISAIIASQMGRMEADFCEQEFLAK